MNTPAEGKMQHEDQPPDQPPATEADALIEAGRARSVEVITGLLEEQKAETLTWREVCALSVVMGQCLVSYGLGQIVDDTDRATEVGNVTNGIRGLTETVRSYSKARPEEEETSDEPSSDTPTA